MRQEVLKEMHEKKRENAELKRKQKEIILEQGRIKLE